MRYLIAFIMGILLAAIPEVADARHCQQFFHHKVQQVVAVPYVYSVGEGIRTDAIVEKALQRFVQKVQAGEIQLNAAPQTLAQTAPQSILAAKCARCHSGPDAKGGHVIDGVSPIDCETFRRSMEMLSGEGAAPPAAMAAVIKQIQAEQKQGDVMQAMLRLPSVNYGDLERGLSLRQVQDQIRSGDAPPPPPAIDNEPDGTKSYDTETGKWQEKRGGKWIDIPEPYPGFKPPQLPDLPSAAPAPGGLE